VDDRSAADIQRNRINLLRERDVHYWCRTFDVSPAQLRAAVQHVGPQADAVQRHLGPGRAGAQVRAAQR
jgi:hypothetical protein